MNAGDVLIDFNRRTAIVVAQGRKLTQLVALEEGELVVRPYNQDELRDRVFRPLRYPLRRAVRQYLKHSGGVSDRARKALRGLLAKGAA